MRPGGRGREGKAKDCNKAAGAGPKAQWGQGAKASPQPHPQPQATRSDALHKFSGGQLKGASGIGHFLYLVHAETPDLLYLAQPGAETQNSRTTSSRNAHQHKISNNFFETV